MDNTTTKVPATAAPAEAEDNREQPATGLGKFKDVDALLEAYNNLEAEFTRRSQRLRELEKAEKEVPPAQAASGGLPPQAEQNSAPAAAAQTDEAVRDRIIAEYLASVAANRSVPLITGGVNVPARRKTPATISEAGALAQQFLNKRR